MQDKLDDKKIGVICKAVEGFKDIDDIEQFREWLDCVNRYSVDPYRIRQLHDLASEHERRVFETTLGIILGVFGEWQFCRVLYKLTNNKALSHRLQKHIKDGMAHMCSGDYQPDWDNQRRMPDTILEFKGNLIWCEVKRQTPTEKWHVGGEGNYRMPEREYNDFTVYKPSWLVIYDNSRKYSIANDPQDWRAGIIYGNLQEWSEGFIHGNPDSKGFLGEPKILPVRSSKDFAGGDNYCFWPKTKFEPLADMLLQLAELP